MQRRSYSKCYYSRRELERGKTCVWKLLSLRKMKAPVDTDLPSRQMSCIVLNNREKVTTTLPRCEDQNVTRTLDEDISSSFLVSGTETYPVRIGSISCWCEITQRHRFVDGRLISLAAKNTGDVRQILCLFHSSDGPLWATLNFFFKLCWPDFFPHLLKPPKRKVIAYNKLALLLLFRLLFCGRNRGDREAFVVIFALNILAWST